jgi:hypothetical protein
VRSLTLVAFSLGLLLSAQAPATATSVVRLDVDQLSDKAEVIIHGRCVRKQARKDRQGDIVTDLTLEVFDGLKGDLGRTFEFTVYGGVLPERGSAIAGAPTFKTGEELLVFLGPVNARGLRMVIGLAQGKYTIRRERGKTLAFRNLQGLRLVDSETGEEHDPEPEQGVPFDELLARIKARLAEKARGE